MDALDQCLAQAMQRAEFREGFLNAWIRQQWESYVGEALAKFSHVVALEQGLLRVAARNAPVMQELHMRSPQIIRAINEACGRTMVTKMKITTGAARKPGPGPYVPGYDLAPPINTEDGVLAKSSMEAINARLARVTDPALQQQLRDLAVQLAKRKHYRRQKGLRDCPRCRRPLSPGETICFHCRQEDQRARIVELRKRLVAQPSLSYEALYREMPCSVAEVMEARRECLQFYIQQLYQPDPPMALRRLVALLMTGKRPEQLRDEQVLALTNPYTMAQKKPWERE